MEGSVEEDGRLAKKLLALFCAFGGVKEGDIAWLVVILKRPLWKDDWVLMC